MSELRPSELRERIEEHSGWRLHLISYRLGDKWLCSVDNVDPAAVLARAEGNTREEAESKALEQAKAMVERTRVF